MDQNTMVGDEVYDGRRFVERFAADGNTVQAAFWVKSTEYGMWKLYVVTELIDRVGTADAYSAVRAALQKLDNCGLRSSEITVIGPNDPIAKEVLAIMAHHPGWSASRFLDKMLRSMDVDQAYVYPTSFFTFSQANPMTTEEVSQEILRSMSHRPGISQPARVNLKDGTAFNGLPFSLEVGTQNSMMARFIADGEAAPRVVRLDDIASIS